MQFTGNNAERMTQHGIASNVFYGQGLSNYFFRFVRLLCTPHDLRRTGATMMVRLGARQDIVEKCLNHGEQNKLIRECQRQEVRTKGGVAFAWGTVGDAYRYGQS